MAKRKVRSNGQKVQQQKIFFYSFKISSKNQLIFNFVFDQNSIFDQNFQKHEFG